MSANVSALVCLAHGTEEIEAVTVIDLLVRAGITVTTASVNGDGDRQIVCSRGVKLLADARLVDVADNDYDAIVLPGGLKGAEAFRDSPLLVEAVQQFHLSGRIVAAICAAAGTVLVPHDLFPIGNMTGFPGLKETIPEDKWVEKRVVWDPRVNLLTSQGPGTAMDFALKLIDLLVGKEKAAEVASQLVLAAGIYDYRE
ncbi:MAG: protein deglycase YajL [Mixta calida]|uniref:Protein deglycase YajL n=1 Tax=Mixta calida TaxID=665913 RepID=A0ABN5H7A5_9GAMM|nr:protein deglycase YajL [Mixta calida]MBS6056608.1 protein deglycase YajL [Pantoea sp.]AUY24449.1 protein deglycase YajL [Mixta calida]KAF0860757.1 oxidative-stress-resistance chaperone [Mixta calida B021323]MDU4941649.1 protein deglycase YajL [Mixta calida]MDU5190383.1 protein deglycase YajL [Mixta calida]